MAYTSGSSLDVKSEFVAGRIVELGADQILIALIVAIASTGLREVKNGIGVLYAAVKVRLAQSRSILAPSEVTL